MRRRIVTRPMLDKRLATEALRIYWTSDIHVRGDIDNNPAGTGAIDGPRLYYAASQKIDGFVAAVNADLPDLAVCTGDIIDRDNLNGDYAIFTSRWNTIDGDVQKEVVPGNHDMVVGYDTILPILGYDAKDVVAGSRFNQAFSISNAYLSARVLMVDTNMADDGTHGVLMAGKLPPDVQTWITGELAACTDDVLLIFSHHGPHDYGKDPTMFDATDAAEIKAIVEAAVTANPALKVWWFFGHDHISGAREQYELGVSLPGIQGAAQVNLNPGKFTKVYVLPEKVVVVRTQGLLLIAP